MHQDMTLQFCEGAPNWRGGPLHPSLHSMPTALCLSCSAQQPSGDKAFVSLERANRQCSWPAPAGELVEIILPDQGDVSVLYHIVCTSSNDCRCTDESNYVVGLLPQAPIAANFEKASCHPSGQLAKTWDSQLKKGSGRPEKYQKARQCLS